MCVIIIKAKELSPSEILGIDIFATYDEDRSLSENSGATKFFPGGPVCHFRGKDVKCLVFASNGGGINSDILKQCLQHMDSICLFDRAIAKPAVVCACHEIQLGIDFMQ